MVLQNAWIDGKPASTQEAVSAAAELIGRSRLPLVTGLSTDIAGIKAAVALAQIAGGAIDHAASKGIYPLISAMRDSGMMLAAPSEIRRRADRVLVVEHGRITAHGTHENLMRDSEHYRQAATLQLDRDREEASGSLESPEAVR